MRRSYASLAGSLLMLTIVSAILPPRAAAQEVDTERPKHALRPGAWAMDLQFQPNLFSSSGSAGISLRGHLSTRSAVRFGFLASISHSRSEGTRLEDRSFPFDTIYTRVDIGNDYDTRDVALFLHYVRYVVLKDRFGMTVGIGPSVRWRSEESSYVDNYPAPRGSYRSSGDRNVWGYGPEVSVGFEYFFYRWLSLGGRYGVLAQWSESDVTQRYDFYNPNDGYWDRRLDETHNEAFTVQTTPALFTLTAYF
jgi:hypothetical protein